MRISALLMMLAFSVQVAFASDETAKVEANINALGLQVESISESPLNDFHEVVTNQGLFYASKDGQHLFAGQLFNIEGEVSNLTEVAQARLRLDKLATIEDEMIVFAAPDEQHRITVFTDHTCGYCRSLHNAMNDYHAAGISVQYAAFPRAGVGSDGARDLTSIWCADDQHHAIDSAKAGNQAIPAECGFDVEKHLNMGRQLGVTGTPAIILEDGRLLSGFRPAAAVLSEINNQ
ncbi:bifunctional protein-disulfide isomerase/oxidoreductase DsbC [Aliidiomarina minuta]|nr:bifunctional protein-disulfide isomerase/oxidoreductase DsbC [Aliidiomarina minuta]